MQDFADGILNLEYHLQYVQHLRFNEISTFKKRELLEKLRKLYKCTRKQSLTRETVAKVEEAIEQLKSVGGETQSYDSCTEFYDLTDAESTNGKMHSSHREKRESYRLQECERRSGKEKSNSYRKDKSRSENIVSTSVSWTKYDKRIERCTRYSPCSDLYSKDDTSESSLESDMQTTSRMKQSTKSSNGKSNRNCRREREDKRFRRVTPDRYWSSYCDRRTSRSPSRPRRTEPERYYSRRAERSSKSRSRSRLRKKSTDRYQRSSSHERGGKRCNRSKSRSRSLIRRGSRGRYFYETADKRTDRSKSRSPTRRKTGPTEQYRRNCSSERDMTYDPIRCQSPSWEGRTDNGLSDVVNKLKTKIKSTLANASNHNKSTERSAEESSCRRSNSSEWQDSWDIDVASCKSSPNRNIAETEDWDQSTGLMPANDQLPVLESDSVLDVNRNKIKFTFAKSLKDDQLTDARSNLCTLIESRLNDRPKEESEPLPVPPGQNIESNIWQTNELIEGDHQMEFDILSEEHRKTTETTIDSRDAKITTDNSIDDDIIQKIISKPANDTASAVELAPNLPFDIDTIKQALATAKSNIEKNVTAVDPRRYIGSALVMNTTAHLVHPNLSKQQEIQSVPIQPQHNFSRPRPYCPVSVPKWMIPNASTIQVAPVQPTPKQSLIAPNSTPAPRPNLLTRPMTVNLPITSPKFLPRISFETPTYPNHTNPFNRNRFNDPFSSNVDRQKISHRRTSVFSERDHTAKHTMTYGEYKKSQASKNLDWNFKIPKKAPTQTITAAATKVVDRSASVTMDEEPNSKGSEESGANVMDCRYYDDNESYSPPTIQPDVCKNNQLDKHSISDNENAADPVDNNPSKEENAIATLKELMASNQFITFVDLMGKITQNDTLTKVKEAFTNCTNNCVPDEEGGESSTSSAANDSTSTDKSRKNIAKRNQKTKATRTRCRSVSPTTTNNIPTDKLPTKSIKKSLPRMAAGSAVLKPIFKNIKLEWHSLKKVLSCQICDKSCLNSLVSHYVNDHPKSEVLVSRLAPDVAESLRSGIGVNMNECKLTRHPSTSAYQFQQLCFFCNVDKTFNKTEWFTHMARHTGYYRYQCNDCSRMFATKPLKISKCALINDFKVISQPSFQSNTKQIKAYVCDLCNYVRFHKNEIEMHLSNEHEDDAKKFGVFKFLSFPTTRRKRKHQSMNDFLVDSGDDSENEYESDWESESENKPVDDGESDVESESKSSDVPVDEEEWETLDSSDDSN